MFFVGGGPVMELCWVVDDMYVYPTPLFKTYVVLPRDPDWVAKVTKLKETCIVIRRAIKPEWEKAGKVHDWRNHVPDEVRAAWNTFTDAQKLLLYNWADDLASSEEWE